MTLLAAIHTRLQGILIPVTGITGFVVAMLLVPRLKLGQTACSVAVTQEKKSGE